MSDVLRILIADGSAADAEREVQALKAGGLQIEREIVCTEPAFRSALQRFSPDVILCGFELPDFDNLTASHIARTMRPMIPLIFVSASVDEEQAVTAMRSGAVDYILKSNLSRLPNAVSRAVEHAASLKGQRDGERRVRRLSRTKDAVSAVNAVMVLLRDESEIFREACRISTETGGFAYCFVMTIDKDTQRVEVRASSGVSIWSGARQRDYLQHVVDHFDDAAGVLAESLRTLRPATTDVRDYPELPIQKDLLNSGINALASFPLIIDGRVAGAMHFAAFGRSRFDDGEMAVISELTNNLAFALDQLEKRQRIAFVSRHDPLTELPNRELFIERLDGALSIARRAGTMAALLLLDVEHLSQVNATLGQRAGDELLRQCAVRLREAVGLNKLARFPGNHFAICFPMLRDLDPILDLLGEDGFYVFSKPFTIFEHEVVVRVNAGCALFPQDGVDVETLTRNAEVALGTGQPSNIEFYSAILGKRLSERVSLEVRLRRAARNGQFLLYYQPKVDMITRELVGVEALLRWRDPERPGSLVLPNEFIPALEETGLIVGVGRWVLAEAARQYTQWRDAGLCPPRIAVNLGARQLLDGNTFEHVRRAVESCGDECGIDLEVTETVLMENLDEAGAMLRDICTLGVEIALDDFGTGYSSLAALHRLPISLVKIDRSFVNGMIDDVSRISMVSTVIKLAHRLGIKVIAECVETEEQARLLRLLRCDQMQGYLVARPGPPESIASMLAPAGVAAVLAR